MISIDTRENLIRLIDQYKNLVFSLCLKLTGDYFISEDLTQETFISVFEHYDSFDGKNEKSWICRIASNKCIDYLRSSERRIIPTSNDEIPERITLTDPLKMYEHKEIMQNLRIICESLASPYKEIGISHYCLGLSAKDISNATGVNLKTVQTQIARTKELLKKSIRKEDLY